MSTTTADREDHVVSTAAILELFAGAVRAATSGVVPAELRILRGAELHGCTDECCARLLADFGPLVAHLPVVDRELHGAAVCIAAAMWHLQRGEDPGPALDAAQAHLNAALDAHQTTAGAA